MSVFEVKDDHFELDGAPFQIISGAIHYFRHVPEVWEDRIRKLKACGFNTLETYIPWNLHEPKEGEFYFEGLADLERFLEIAQKYGLYVIVRPSQYICAEWEFGGFPAWLLKDRNLSLRCADPKYLQKIDAYFRVLIPKLAKYQCTCGGPILLCQIENEYGSYGNDKIYLSFLEQEFRKYGMDILLFTSDGGTDTMLRGGTLPHIFKTANFGSHPKENFAKLREYQPEGPSVCMEYWNGWFDHWGEAHHVRDPKDAVDTFREMLESGASVSFYMFCGGTNFGFMNGANCPKIKEYQPTITSYDYCAPLTEEGNITPKYELLRDLLKDYRTSDTVPEIVPFAPSEAYGTVPLTEQIPLRRAAALLTEPQTSAPILPMEQYGQNYGSILYRTRIAGPYDQVKLTLKEVHDRAHVFINGNREAILWRNDPDSTVTVSLPEKENVLEILVENLGRINYGPYLQDEKGITEAVFLEYQMQFGWEVFPLELQDLSPLRFEAFSAPVLEPCFLRGTFRVGGTPADTYLRTDGLEHGTAWVNGFCLGRYWNSKGPQKTLYVPASLLHSGENEVILLEYDAVSDPIVTFSDHSDLG